ncbi:ORF6N domain-containing protein [Flavobacterium sp. 3-210]
MEDQSLLSEETISNKIFFIRGQKVMLDYDLASLYEVETKRLNEQVKKKFIAFSD